jgi:hypothetical protein
MVRHASGFFVRHDRVRVAPGITVRVLSTDRRQLIRAQLVALGLSDLALSALRPPALGLGCKAFVAITLPGRYIEFELPGVVDWEDGPSFGIRLEHLTARQAYGMSLARELMRAPLAVSASRHAGRR